MDYFLIGIIVFFIGGALQSFVFILLNRSSKGGKIFSFVFIAGSLLLIAGSYFLGVSLEKGLNEQSFPSTSTEEPVYTEEHQPKFEI